MPGITECVLCPEMKMFGVKVGRGKILHSGGFGVGGVVSSIEKDDDRDEDDNVNGTTNSSVSVNNDEVKMSQEENVDEKECGFEKETRVISSAEKDDDNGNEHVNGTTTTTCTSNDVNKGESNKEINEKEVQHQNQTIKQPSEYNCYLFIEEVLFLEDRGLIQVWDHNDQIMESYQLFDLLKEWNVPLISYLVYAYLRCQTYIVLRHIHRNVVVDDDGGDRLKTRRLELRKRMLAASPPSILDSNTSWDEKDAIPIAFDVYLPNKRFQKADPGTPDFHVAIACYSVPSPPFSFMASLMDACDGIPLRFAVIADGGTVMMYGLTRYEVPCITDTDRISSNQS